MSLARFSAAAIAWIASCHAAFGQTEPSFVYLPASVQTVIECTPDVDYVVGDGTFTSGATRAYRWSEAAGMLNVGGIGAESHALGVNENGTTVVGYYLAGNGATRAFYWTPVLGAQDLGNLGADYAVAHDVSADGLAVVGESRTEEGDTHAFTSVAGEVLLDLGTLGGNASQALFVSEDGTRVIGRSRNAAGDWRLFRWTLAGGMTDLGSLGGTELEIRDVNADASYVVGTAALPSGVMVPFGWSDSTGIRRTGPFGSTAGSAEVVSDQGGVIAGHAETTAALPQAFRAVGLSGAGETVQRLGDLNPGQVSYATAVDLDGELVAGSTVADDGTEQAYIWTGAAPAWRLDLLRDVFLRVFDPATVDSAAYRLPYCLSADGRTILVQGEVGGAMRFLKVAVPESVVLFDRRPRAADIQTYVDATHAYAEAMLAANPTSAEVQLVRDYAYYASEYQRVATLVTQDPYIPDFGIQQYLDYRYNALLMTYYAFLYSYEPLYLASGGALEYSYETAYNAYVSYLVQEEDFLTLLDDYETFLYGE